MNTFVFIRWVRNGGLNKYRTGRFPADPNS